MEQTPQSPSQPPSGGWYKATFLRRLLAALVDGIIVIVINFGLSLALTFSGILNSSNQMLLSWLLWLLATQYMVLMTWKYGAPLGKMWLKIKVVRTDGANLSFGRAFLREVIGKFISGLVLNLGYLWMLWDKNRQTWHDKIADTYVVTKIPNSGKNSGCLIVLIIGVVAFIPVVAILAAVAVLIIDPLELTRRGNDAKRQVDEVILEQAITSLSANNPDFSLCADNSSSCFGISTAPGSSAIDGSGWVKVVFPPNTFKDGVLPIDPTNQADAAYVYCSDGTDWEINMVMESKEQKPKMVSDKGDNNNLYEIGSNLNLCQ